MTTQLTFSKIILPAAPAVVFEMLTSPMLLESWLCENADIEANAGGRIYFGWQGGNFLAGNIEAIEPDQKLAFKWPNGGEGEFKLTSAGDGTELKFTHRTSDPNIHQQFEKGFENLAYLMETGLTLAFMSRPVLGARTPPLSEAAAQRLGLPDVKGVIIEFIQEGLAAEQARLQPQDVLYMINGTPFKHSMEMFGILGQHKGGDVIEIGYYRDGKAYTTPLTLSPRPHPNFPTTLKALADTLEKRHAEQDAELAAMLAGVPEEILMQRPAENEWSAGEVIAHLIFTENFYQVMLCHRVARVENGPWPGNQPVQIAGLMAAYPTSADLFKALQAAERATVGAIRAMPESLTDYQAIYAPTSFEMNSKPDHTRGHLAQIQRVIELVKEATPA